VKAEICARSLTPYKHAVVVAICERNGNKTVPAVFRDGHFAPRSFTTL
jgi:hypothetical protein